MKFLYTIGLFLCISTITVDAQPSGTWQKFTSVDNMVSVLFPGTPKSYTKEIHSLWGGIINESYISTADEEPINGVSFVVNRLRYPLGQIDSDSLSLIDDLLEETLGSLLETNKMGKVYSNDQMEGPYHGKIFRFADNERGISIKGKCFYGKSEIIILMVYTSTNQSLLDQIDWFLKSFRYVTD